MKVSWKGIVFAAIITLLMAGCARPIYRPRLIPGVLPEGVHHRVEEGETLWRIAKIYGVSVEEIKANNDIRDVRDLKVGSLIFVPGARERMPIAREEEISKEGFIWPVRGKIVSHFGTGRDNISKGIDIASISGTKVRAAKSGTVSYADTLRGHGKVVIIDHQDGFSTVYAHNSKIMVREGDFVRRGQVVALSGDTGHPTRPTLHFQIRRGAIPKNPLNYLP